MTVFSDRLKFLRRRKNLTLDQLAQQCGLSKGYLSKLEREICEPTISSVMKIGHALDVGVGSLLGEGPRQEQVCVTRSDEYENVDQIAEETGHVIKAVATKRTVKRMEPFVVRPLMHEPEPIDASRHSGEEFLYVISGKVEVKIWDELIRLSRGDSLYFDATIPHKIHSIGRVRATVLVVVAQ